MPRERRCAATPGTILRELNSTLQKMGATHCRVETAVRLTGPFRQQLARIGVRVAAADPLTLAPPAMRVVFTRDGREYPYQCGKWAAAINNLRAVQRTIAHLYAIYEDYGVTGEAASEAEARERFASIMALGSGASRWWDVLGVPRTAPREQIRAAYNALALRHHPDKGGRRADWDRVQRAYEEATTP